MGGFGAGENHLASGVVGSVGFLALVEPKDSLGKLKIRIDLSWKR